MAVVAVKFVVKEDRFATVPTFRVPTLAVGVTREFRFETPETFRDVRIPTLVMFGWAACETTRATFAFATFPTKFDELRAYRAAPFAETFDTVTKDGRSAETRARKVGAAVPETLGPAKTVFWTAVVTPKPPEA